MTLEKAEDCSYIRISGCDQLNAFYVDSLLQVPTGITAELGVICMCDGNETVYQIDASDLTLDGEGNTYFDITKAFLETSESEEKLDDGIYQIRLTITNPDLSFDQRTICVAITCQLECLAMTYLADNLKSNIWKYILALSGIQNCDGCFCEAGCLLYNHVLSLLDNETPKNCANCG